MNYISRNLHHIAAICVAAAVGLGAVAAYGQDGTYKIRTKSGHSESRSFCSDDDWSSDGRASFKDLRETKMAATGSLTVDSGQNGGISVKGEDRSDVLVRACVRAWEDTNEGARAIVSGVRISTGGTIKAEGSASDNHWSVSFQILVPRSTDLDLSARNGGIHITSVNGTAQFETQNGGVHLSDLSGSVKGRTTNGGVHVELTGTSWRGSGMDVTTTNGGVHVAMPANYAAHFETGTVNGGFHSSIAGLNAEVPDGYRRSRATKISTDLNGGGATIRLITTNGGVHIGTSED
ncbi:MAG: hypothetical protein ABIV21_05240 [Pyrinomonadaceae bacterium]